MEKGKLPVTEKIVLESGEEQWKLQANGLITELRTSGLIEKEPGMKVRVNMTFTKVIPPEQLHFTDQMALYANFEEVFIGGMYRSYTFLYEFLHKSTWLFFGHIEGDERIPVMVLHIHDIGVSIYTQKLKSEQMKIFHPAFPGLN